MESQPRPYDTHQQDTEAINQSWQHVVDSLTQATLEYVEVDDETRANLASDFWPTHAELFARAEKENPGIAKTIMDRADEISAAARAAEIEVFETKTLPVAKRRAYMRGFMNAFSLDGE